MSIMRLLSRPIARGFVLSLLLIVFAGCSSNQPVAQKVQQPEKKKIEFNPFAWDLKQASYDFREKYNFKIGNMWIIKPPRQFNPSEVVVLRELGEMPEKPQAQPPVAELYDAYVKEKQPTPGILPAPADIKPGTTQMLVIDLISCDAILRDVDGREYTCQVAPAVARKLINITTDPTWLRQKKGKVKQVGEDEWGYRSLFQEVASDYPPVPRNWKISETSVNADVTEAQRLLSEAFEVAHRAVHPLSESVDLLK